MVEEEPIEQEEDPIEDRDPKEEYVESENPNAIQTKEGNPKGETIGDDDNAKELVEESREPEIVSLHWKREGGV